MSDAASDASDLTQRSSRDPETLRQALEAWIGRVLPAGADPRVPAVEVPSSSGMSSETLLFDASWTEGGVERRGELVARLEPAVDDVPVFPTYDLESQFRIMRLVGEASRVPVPAVRWLELDPSHLGARFLVMERVHGRVPPDILPYTMEGWLLAATPEERDRLEQATVDVLAALHAIDPATVDASFLEFDLPGDTPLRRHVENQRRYYEWVRAGTRRHPVLDEAFAWLDAHWPADEGDTVISWGDSRIGNVLYDGFEPAAVLDWEMAALGPRGLDVGWLVMMHVFFQDITERSGLPGLPDFLARDRVAARYEERTGRALPDLDWYIVYAGLRHGIVMARIKDRMVRFGQAEWTDDVDDAIPHRDVLRAMMTGAYGG